ncbi:hypothetical protein K458DRAFT_64381 [Lentithecium fluviatile CBS 122367]|uniref:Uncharacterized protein n=1 Tax=Lentithecium fluviatile CBS 122367 TaxID=1168545 RepID=A0A6G1JK34_9PLEO|nr:hypothetical protein K458DRAFT_64381 [Lentithecium fluviatile CBS 122367]
MLFCKFMAFYNLRIMTKTSPCFGSGSSDFKKPVLPVRSWQNICQQRGTYSALNCNTLVEQCGNIREPFLAFVHRIEPPVLSSKIAVAVYFSMHHSIRAGVNITVSKGAEVHPNRVTKESYQRCLWPFPITFRWPCSKRRPCDCGMIEKVLPWCRD